MEMLEDDEVVVRPEIMAFAVAMERVMAAHDSDYGNSYRHMDVAQLRHALLTIHKRAVHIDEALSAVSDEAATIANLAARIGCYAMFFHNRFCYAVSEETDARTTD